MNRSRTTGYSPSLPERLGVKEEFTEGNTEEDWIEKVYNYSDLPKYISFEDFKKKGLFHRADAGEL